MGGDSPHDPAVGLRPLTPAQRRDLRCVANAYSDFFNHVKFKKNWASPPFTRSEVLPLFEEAAEIVVRARSDLDEKDGGAFKLRMVDGSAREYLWTVTGYHPLDYPEKFVVDLVHATFQDGRGYVEGLTQQVVDDYICRFSGGRLDPARARRMPMPRPRGGPDGADGSSSTTTSKEGQPLERVQSTALSRSKSLEGGAGGGHLVRQCSVMGKEREIVQGASTVWAGVRDKMRKVEELIGQGVIQSDARMLRGLRRVAVDLQAVDLHLDELVAMVDKEAATATATAPQSEQQVTPGKEVSGHEGLAASVEELAIGDKASKKEEEETKGREPLRDADAPVKAEETPAPPAPAPVANGKEEQQEEGAHGGPVAMEEDVEEEEEEEEPPMDEGKIEIQRVAEDVGELKAKITSLTESVKGLDSHSLQMQPGSVKVLEALQSRCAGFIESLMKGLEVLDSLPVKEEDRPLRKSQVLSIQQLLDDVDHLQERLRVLHTDLKRQEDEEKMKVVEEEGKRRKGRDVKHKPKQHPPRAHRMEEDEEEEEEEPEKLIGEDEREEQEQEMAGPAGPGPAASHVRSYTLKDLASLLASHWRQMKMRPKLQSQYHPEASCWVVQSYIPGMRMSDVSVTVGPRKTITIEGFRGPSLKDLQMMCTQLSPGAPIEAVLRAGAGRFGSFVENLRLPEDAYVEDLEASYEGGVLRVVIPRMVVEEEDEPAYVMPPPRRRGPPLRAPQPPPPPPPAYYGYGRGRGPALGGGGGGFWNDRDLWW